MLKRKRMNPVLENQALKRDIVELQLRLSLSDALTERKVSAGIQAALDAAAIANSDVFKMGVGRALTWKNRVDEILQDMVQCAGDETNLQELRPGKEKILGDAEIPATREQIDRRLKQIFGEENFQPFEKRYEWGKTEQIYKKHGVVRNKT